MLSRFSSKLLKIKSLPSRIAARTVILSLVAATLSLTACTSNQEVTQTQPNTAPSDAVQSSPSPTQTVAKEYESTTEVENLGEVKFQDEEKSPVIGSFDAVNNSTQLNHTISKTTPIEVTGWAILPEENKPADNIIITEGENNTVVTIIPVNIARADVAQAQKNSAFEKSGWKGTIEPSNLQGDKVTLKAWGYNAQNKEAIVLESIHEISLN